MRGCLIKSAVLHVEALAVITKANDLAPFGRHHPSVPLHVAPLQFQKLFTEFLEGLHREVFIRTVADILSSEITELIYTHII